MLNKCELIGMEEESRDSSPKSPDYIVDFKFN